MVGAQHHESELSLGEVLLVSDVLVCCDHDLESGLLSRLDQIAIGPTGPADLCHHLDGKSREVSAETNGHTFIKQDTTHRCPYGHRR